MGGTQARMHLFVWLGMGKALQSVISKCGWVRQGLGWGARGFGG